MAIASYLTQAKNKRIKFRGPEQLYLDFGPDIKGILRPLGFGSEYNIGMSNLWIATGIRGLRNQKLISIQKV